MTFLFALIGSVLAGGHEGLADPPPGGPGSRDLPRPNVADVLPCECQADESYQMDMRCSCVGDGDLARIFSADFPFEHFREIEIRRSDDLTVLQEGDFGQASFEEVFTDRTGLAEEQARAFASSYSTLTTIVGQQPHLDISLR